MRVKCNYLFFIVLLGFSARAQHHYKSYSAHHSVWQAIHVSKDIIKAKIEVFEKKSLEKPLMFLNVKHKISELNRLSNSLSSCIEKLQEEVNTERVLYALLEEYHYKNIIFTNNGKLSAKGKQIKVKIDSLYELSSKINIHKLTHLEDFVNNHFKTNGDYYNEEDKIDYFNYLFYDKSNYGIMMSLSYLLLDVKTFQLLYLGTVTGY
ncbi:hypothetical protein ACE1MK_13825 [Tenacibaculum maritimum]|uniref:hypothetical protein n=1 Tax=Tenacibaculum maritimum TaxID=107401 RepID=UPI0012E5A01E|nr:hypothetical protein [Tenacibaculum maritimum]MCD9582201.1 hypothetical protein [Tenacibaculum maritimum]MCD9636580.1 hypothetical protein [Tenacibaculum maritimum]CAA0169641.1 exported hypothetical protein [Tenacibaculum maritimum]CAA0213251.1 exported hypothetical protein [Tenacibaculum maritimum]